ncbi:hypothetical protein [Thermoflexus sp.]|uniref:hypothetical protein n=1 Tax=Thermoflexus sp. TaxID=1969742 RepID=UPI0035E41B36
MPVLLLLQGTQGLASRVSRLPGQNEVPPPAWQEAIERIDQALESGEIALEQAVRLRLRALQDPFALPEDYRPLRTPQAYARPPAQCGLPEAMAKTWALFRDQDQWDESTKAFVEQEIQRLDQEQRTRLTAMEALETERTGICKYAGGIPGRNLDPFCRRRDSGYKQYLPWIPAPG